MQFIRYLNDKIEEHKIEERNQRKLLRIKLLFSYLKFLNCETLNNFYQNLS